MKFLFESRQLQIDSNGLYQKKILRKAKYIPFKEIKNVYLGVITSSRGPITIGVAPVFDFTYTKWDTLMKLLCDKTKADQQWETFTRNYPILYIETYNGKTLSYFPNSIEKCEQAYYTLKNCFYEMNKPLQVDIPPITSEIERLARTEPKENARLITFGVGFVFLFASLLFWGIVINPMIIYTIPTNENVKSTLNILLYLLFLAYVEIKLVKYFSRQSEKNNMARTIILRNILSNMEKEKDETLESIYLSKIIEQKNVE